MDGYGDFVWDNVATTFNRWRHHGVRIFRMTPRQLVQHGICDPVKLFIKNEPHSAKKMAAGKLRLIASVSLKDQIVTRLLSSRQNKAEIATWESCPSAPGMGLNDSGMKILGACGKFILSLGDMAETDVKGWDWSVQDWELMLDARIRAALAGADQKSEFAFFLRVHAYCVANSVFVLPNGDMYEQTIPGGQLSGDYNTSSTNSRMRVMASMFSRMQAGRPLLVNGHIGVKAMGDDSFEVHFPELGDGLVNMGHEVGEVNVRRSLSEMEFCSQRWNEDGTAVPVDPSKTVYRYLSHNPLDPYYPEYMAQLMFYLRHMRSGEIDVIGEIAAARVARATNFTFVEPPNES
jgi:hypothetical protein